MQVSKVTRAILEDAAREVGVKVDVRTVNAAGTRHRVKVNPGDARLPRADGRRGVGDTQYQRTSPEGRRVHAVCWHGFRDYFRAVYRREPGAVFRTAVETWKGAEDFETRFRFSGDRNIGSMMHPCRMVDACICPDSGSTADRD